MAIAAFAFRRTHLQLGKLIEALVELEKQRGPSIDVRTMPVFMFDSKNGKLPGICEFFVGEQTQVVGGKAKMTRTVILEVT